MLYLTGDSFVIEMAILLSNLLVTENWSAPVKYFLPLETNKLTDNADSRVAFLTDNHYES